MDRAAVVVGVGGGEGSVSLVTPEVRRSDELGAAASR